jgi:tripartite-type tricarboxylate transporter receptor subunit TctC
LRDFAPITAIEQSVNALVVHPSLPPKSVSELIALARSRPGELNYASAGTGSTPHLAGELFKSMAKVDMVHVPYKGNAQALTDLIGGQVQLGIPSLPSVMPHIKSGRLRAIAVTSAASSALLPGLPTVATTVPGYECVGITAFFAPAKTPAAIIKRLNEEAVRYLRTAEAKEVFLKNGAETIGNSPDQLAAASKAEIERFGKLIKDLGLRLE